MIPGGAFLITTGSMPNPDAGQQNARCARRGRGAAAGVSLGGSVGPTEPVAGNIQGGWGGLFRIRDASELRLADGSYFAA